MTTQLTFEEWAERFKPIKNPFADRGYDGTLFETYSDDIKMVVAWANDPTKRDQVWTLGASGEDMWVTEGYHYVDRMGYFLTEVPCPRGEVHNIVLAEARFQAVHSPGFDYVVVDTEQDRKVVCSVSLAMHNGYQVAQTIADALTAQNAEDELEFDLTREDDEDGEESVLELNSPE